jgi:hypothetical protein
MATATRIYTAEASSSSMKSAVTSASDSTVLGANIDVRVLVAKTATNKDQIVTTLQAVIQKIIEENSPN